MDYETVIRHIRECSEIAHQLLADLHEDDADNETFTQTGLLDRQEIIDDYLSHNELGAALEHLLYMIHESDMHFDQSRVVELHAIAKQFNINSHYASSNPT